MESKVSAVVSSNSIQEIISQIREREALISEKILAFEIFREKILIILSFLFVLVFFLVILNLLFLFRFRKNFILNQKFQKNLKLSEKNKTIKKSSIIEKLKFQPFSSCEVKNCIFFRHNKPCQLKEFGQRLVNFYHLLSQNWEKKFWLDHLLKLGEEISQNCDKNSLLLVKKRLKRVRNILNRVKREKGVPKSLKQESKSLWNIAHSLSLKIKKQKDLSYC